MSPAARNRTVTMLFQGMPGIPHYVSASATPLAQLLAVYLDQHRRRRRHLANHRRERRGLPLALLPREPALTFNGRFPTASILPVKKIIVTASHFTYAYTPMKFPTPWRCGCSHRCLAASLIFHRLPQNPGTYQDSPRIRRFALLGMEPENPGGRL